MSTFCWQQPASTFSFSFPQPQWFLNSSNCEDQHLRGNQHDVVDQHRRDQRANHQNASKVVFDNNRFDNTGHQALIGCQRNMPGTTGIPRRDLQQRHGNVVALHHNRTSRSHEGCGNRTDQGDQRVNTHAEFWQGDPQQEPNTGCNNSFLPPHWGPLHDQQWTDDPVLVHSEQGPTASAAGQQEHQLVQQGILDASTTGGTWDSTSIKPRCPTMRTTWCNRASESVNNKGWSSDHPDALWRHQNNRADECNKTYLNWELNHEVNSTIDSSWIQQWFSVQQTYTISIDNVFDQHFTL